MNDSTSKDLSKKLNVLISLAFRQLLQDKEFGQRRRPQGTGDLAPYLADMGIDAKDIAEIPWGSVDKHTNPSNAKATEVKRWGDPES